MLNLIYAIISSALVSTFMRISEDRIHNNMAMFFTNYLVCAGLSLYFMGAVPLMTVQPGLAMTLAFGLFSGIMYLATFLLLQYSIRKNGVVMSATFMKLGVVIPTLMAIVFFKEKLRLLQLLGILFALAAIILVHFEKEELGRARYKLLLLVLLIGNGINDSTANIYDKLGNLALKDHYLFYTFAMAGICSLILWRKRGQSICMSDMIWGTLIGIPNYFSSRFLLAALHQLPAVVVYPGYSVLTIAIITVLGLLMFKEVLSRKKVWAMGLILISLFLLNL